MQAQIDLAPQQYAAEAEFRPQYAALDLKTLQTALNGTGDQKGLLDLYENSVYPALTRAQAADTKSRTASDLDIIQSLGGQVTSALREASGTAGLVDQLSKQASEGLAAGASLDPSLANEVEQGVRSAQAARGFGFGSADAVQEAFARGERGQALRQQRQQFAQQTVGTLQATGGDPVLALLGRPSQTVAAGQGVGGQAGGMRSGNIFNPESSYAADVNNTNFNAKAAAKIAQANNDTAITAAGISAAGNMASSL